MNIGLFAFFRALLVVHLAGIITQVLTAGVVLSGSEGALAVHSLTPRLNQAVCLLMLLVAILLRRRRVISAAAVAISGALFVAEAAETALGFLQVLAVHVPLAIAIILLNARLLDVAWRTREAG